MPQALQRLSLEVQFADLIGPNNKQLVKIWGPVTVLAVGSSKRSAIRSPSQVRGRFEFGYVRGWLARLVDITFGSEYPDGIVPVGGSMRRCRGAEHPHGNRVREFGDDEITAIAMPPAPGVVLLPDWVSCKNGAKRR